MGLPLCQSDGTGVGLVAGACSDGDATLMRDASVTGEPQVPMREDLLELFEISELGKYFTDAELADHPARKTYDAQRESAGTEWRRQRRCTSCSTTRAFQQAAVMGVLPGPGLSVLLRGHRSLPA